jgi:hypothetical protein
MALLPKPFTWFGPRAFRNARETWSSGRSQVHQVVMVLDAVVRNVGGRSKRSWCGTSNRLVSVRSSFYRDVYKPLLGTSLYITRVSIYRIHASLTNCLTGLGALFQTRAGFEIKTRRTFPAAFHFGAVRRETHGRGQ